MKTMKRIMFMALALMVLASIMIVPASAREPINEHYLHEFRYYFPMMSRNVYDRGYTIALQRFLLGFPQSSSHIANSGGPDGIYGNGTFNAVKAFQTEAKKTYDSDMQVDGVTGGDTWSAVAYNLTYGGGDVYFYSGNTRVMYPDQVNGRNVLKNLDDTIFHYIVGYVPEM